MSGTTSNHELYMQGLRNAHAQEVQAIELMQRQVDRLENYPEVRSALVAHIKESEQQRDRLEQILGTHGTSHSTLKDMATGLTANLAAIGHTLTTDEILKNMFANFAFEHFEIASYTSLITMAQAVGDQQHIPLLQQNLQEEVAMAKRVGDQIAPVTQRYMQLSAAGQTAKV